MYFFEDTHEHLVDDDVFEIDDVDCSEEYLTYDEEMERFESLTYDQQFDDEPFSPDDDSVEIDDDFVESP
jgi:hypothetical protein